MIPISLIEKKALTPSLYSLTFERPTGFSFEAGQFARLGLALTSETEPLMRAYSIASSPAQNSLRFLITRVEGGKLSPRLTDLQPSQCALLDEHAEGLLRTNRLEGGKTLWCLATGSGLAPFISIVTDRATWQKWQHVIVVQGVRYGAEAVAATQLTSQWQEALPDIVESGAQLDVYISSTRDKTPEPIDTMCGRITDCFENGTLERVTRHSINRDDARILICGNPDFVKSMRNALKTRDIITPRLGRPGQLIVENFW